MIFEGCMDYMARHMPFEGTKSLVMILLMEEILHQLIGCLSLFLHVSLHPRWLFGISEPSTVSFMAPEFITFCHWGLDVLRALQHFADGERRPGAQPRLRTGFQKKLEPEKNEKKNSKKWAYVWSHTRLPWSFQKWNSTHYFFLEMAGERKATHQRNETRERSFSCELTYYLLPIAGTFETFKLMMFRPSLHWSFPGGYLLERWFPVPEDSVLGPSCR